MPNLLLPLLLPPPPHTMCYAARHLTEEQHNCPHTRSGRQLEVAQRQHAYLCKNTSGKAVTLHTILLGVGGTCYNEHATKDQASTTNDVACSPGASKLACELHAHSVKYAHKLVTTRRAIGNNFKNISHSQVLESGAPSNHPDPF
eukprot:1150751-Pelagomonas_calceolata.AAC.3